MHSFADTSGCRVSSSSKVVFVSETSTNLTCPCGDEDNRKFWFYRSSGTETSRTLFNGYAVHSSFGDEYRFQKEQSITMTIDYALPTHAGTCRCEDVGSRREANFELIVLGEKYFFDNPFTAGEVNNLSPGSK